MTSDRRVLLGGVAVVVVALVVGIVLIFRPTDDGRNHLTVDFDRTVSLYEGADVRILGVPVGQVDSVEPTGQKVRVELSWDDEYKVPDDAKAVIVSPAIVGDRYIQLTPAYESGPEMEDGTVLDASDTAVPVELDEIYGSLDQLATALGPKGANKDGALDRLLSNSARAFDGQGKKFHRMLRNLSKLTGTLDDNKDELFGSMKQLERFTKALADNDTVVRRFNSDLADVSRMLRGERDDLAGALRALGSSLNEVRSYVKQNRGTLKRNVRALVDVTNQLVDQRRNLAKVLDSGPTALSNQVLAYDPSIGAMNSRSMIHTESTPFIDTFGLDSGIVSPPTGSNAAELSVWSGATRVWCSQLSSNGMGPPLEMDVARCLQAFPTDYFEYLSTRGLNQSSTAGDQLSRLRRTDESAGLASLLAVNR